MKVKTLIKELQKCDQERIVIMASDSEGNNYSPIDDVYTGAYDSGEFGMEELTEKDKKDGYTEEDIIDGKKAVCFYPIN